MALEGELARLRQPLLRFAQLQLRDPALAEDAVSETMLAILERPGQFAGRSSLRTYATGILKFKVIDILRQRSREVVIEPDEEHTIDEAIEALFAEDGHYRETPQPWQEPEQALAQTQLLQVLQDCVDALPPRLGRVFMMREWLEMDTGAICTELGINANHCGVLLYRARMLLRECLNLRWFQEREA